MQLRMWTYDIAREQTPTLESLTRLCDLTLESGYNAVGLYLEHRFAYPSTPWSHGKNLLTPEDITELQRRHPDLQIIPCINLLGHFEGMLYTEHGSQFAEERFKGLQADPANPAFVELAQRILDDTLSIFKSDIIHIGGDETAQLGAGQTSSKLVSQYAATNEAGDGKAELYGRHFGPLAQRVVDAGRTPAVWADMFFEHPTALSHMPPSTLLFDWQYFRSPEHTSKMLRESGRRVVFCPALHTYNATWCHLPQSEQNVVEHAEAAERLGAYGVCLTTWECGLFGNYETLLPAIQASGKILQSPPEVEPNPDLPLMPGVGQGGELALRAYRTVNSAPRFLQAYNAQSEAYAEWAQLMGVELQTVGNLFEFDGIRSSLKCRLLLYSNPFLLWLRDRDHLLGEAGDKALHIAEKALAIAPDANTRGVAQLLSKSIEFVRLVEEAHQAYAAGQPGKATAALAPCRQIFDDLEKVAVATQINAQGSLADIERCKRAREHVETVIRRVREYGDGSLGYLPSFEVISHPKFMPHDQASWWLINRWANE